MKALFFEKGFDVGVWSERHKGWIVYSFKTEKEALNFYHTKERGKECDSLTIYTTERVKKKRTRD
jgi:hypothetical protein